MDDIAEFILTIIHDLFQPKYLDLQCRIENVNNRALKLLLKILLVLVYAIIFLLIIGLMFGLVCLIDYWIKK